MRRAVVLTGKAVAAPVLREQANLCGPASPDMIPPQLKAALGIVILGREPELRVRQQGFMRLVFSVPSWVLLLIRHDSLLSA
jgi:hypothetical protein